MTASLIKKIWDFLFQIFYYDFVTLEQFGYKIGRVY